MTFPIQIQHRPCRAIECQQRDQDEYSREHVDNAIASKLLTPRAGSSAENRPGEDFIVEHNDQDDGAKDKRSHPVDNRKQRQHYQLQHGIGEKRCVKKAVEAVVGEVGYVGEEKWVKNARGNKVGGGCRKEEPDEDDDSYDTIVFLGVHYPLFVDNIGRGFIQDFSD